MLFRGVDNHKAEGNRARPDGEATACAEPALRSLVLLPDFEHGKFLHHIFRKGWFVRITQTDATATPMRPLLPPLLVTLERVQSWRIVATLDPRYGEYSAAWRLVGTSRWVSMWVRMWRVHVRAIFWPCARHGGRSGMHGACSLGRSRSNDRETLWRPHKRRVRCLPTGRRSPLTASAPPPTCTRTPTCSCAQSSQQAAAGSGAENGRQHGRREHQQYGTGHPRARGLVPARGRRALRWHRLAVCTLVAPAPVRADEARAPDVGGLLQHVPTKRCPARRAEDKMQCTLLLKHAHAAPHLSLALCWITLARAHTRTQAWTRRSSMGRLQGSPSAWSGRRTTARVGANPSSSASTL